MATILTGNVIINRIWELLAKTLTRGELAQYSVAIDKQGEADTKRMTLEELVAFAESGIFTPVVEPTITLGSPNTLILDCENSQQCKFEPRLSTGTLTINVDFTFSLTNTTKTEVISFFLSLTGTRIIQLSSSYLVSIASSIGSWNNSTYQLTISAGTDDLIEFSILWNNTASKWALIVGEVNT